MSAEIKGDGFYINFNPDTSQGIFGDSDGGAETALIFKDMLCGKDNFMWRGNQFYILKGNFISDYKVLIEKGASKWELKSFYDEQKKRYGSRHSSDFHDWGKDGEMRLAAQGKQEAQDEK